MVCKEDGQQFSFWRSTGIDLRVELKPLDHEIHQVSPTVKDHIPRSGPDILEKRLAPGQHPTQQGILVIAPFQYRMEQKGQEVKTEQKRGEVLLAMPTGVLQMVAFGLQYVMLFVCDLPAPTARLCDGCDIVRVQAMRGDKAVVIVDCRKSFRV